MSTAAHRDPRLLVLVAAGGAAGTLLRYAVDQLLPAPGGWPLATLAVNIVGCLLLSVLLGYLQHSAAETSRGRRWRLGIGTGFCGGLTTYSSFAVETDVLLGNGNASAALAYVAVSVVAGLAAAGLGIALGGRLSRRRAS